MLEIGYAYPTSNIAAHFGLEMEGCAYLREGGKSIHKVFSDAEGYGLENAMNWAFQQDAEIDPISRAWALNIIYVRKSGK